MNNDVPAIFVPAFAMETSLVNRCVEAVCRSMEYCDLTLEILLDSEGDKEYNKSKALNRLLDKSANPVIAILDADCQVPLDYATMVYRAFDLTVDRICFQVLEGDAGTLRFFAVDTPWNDGHAQPKQTIRSKKAVFGNALWASRRTALAGIRWNEDLCGRGFEDIEHTCRVVKARGGINSWHGRVADSLIIHETHSVREWGNSIPGDAQQKALRKAMEEVQF